jgi:uncharacterized protein YbbK (DUF523 family)
MKRRLKLGISSCLLGKKVRYDASHRLDSYIKNRIDKSVQWVAVCPEVECGLSVPREEMHLVGTPESARLVTRFSRIDHTDRLLKWSRKKLKELEKEKLQGFVFKSNSPSCGLKGVKIYNKESVFVKKGSGIFAKEFVKYFRFMPVIEDTQLHSYKKRKRFMEKVL